MPPRSLRTLEAQHCVLIHPKPNWILFCVDEEIDVGSIELLSLKLFHQSLTYPNLLLKSYKNVVLGGHAHERKNTTTKKTTWVVEGVKLVLGDYFSNNQERFRR